MKSKRCAAALVAAGALIALQACGGGGGNGSLREPPVMSSAEIKAELSALIDGSDTIIEERSRHIFWGPQREARPIRHPFNLDDIAYNIFGDRSLAADGEYEFGDAEGGISHAAAAWESTEIYGSPPRQQVNVHISYGAWMKHSFFLVMETLGADPVDDYISVYPDIFSIGAASGTNPVSGSATWIGVMIAVDEAFAGRSVSRLEDGDLNYYGGAALVTLTSFVTPMADVTFTDITNAVTEHRLPDVAWRDLPVVEGGFEGNGILGRFYGPQHEEVGGVFQFGDINGAFGAVRE